jgi:hypothetical protein
VSDESPPLVYDGLDPAPAPKSAFAEISDALNEAITRVSGAIEAGRKPGRPLSILSNVTREAPLGSLLVATARRPTWPPADFCDDRLLVAAPVERTGRACQT